MRHEANVILRYEATLTEKNNSNEDETRNVVLTLREIERHLGIPNDWLAGLVFLDPVAMDRELTRVLVALHEAHVDVGVLEQYTNNEIAEAALNPAVPMLLAGVRLYRERRGTYGPSEQLFADVMTAMFPKGLTLTSREDWVRYGIFHQIVGKLTRYANDFFDPHVDSIQDTKVYAAMLEAEDRRVHRAAPFNAPREVPNG